MADRRSGRIAAAKARLRTGNPKATRSSNRIANMNKVRANDRQKSPGVRKPESPGRNATGARTANRKKRPTQNPRRASDRRPPSRQPVADDTTRDADAAASRSSGPAGDIPRRATGGGHHIPEAAEAGDRKSPPTTTATHETPPPGEANIASDEPEPDLHDHNDGTQAEEDHGLQLFQILLSSVTAQRALRRMRAELKTCEEEIHDAQFMIRTNRNAMGFRNPETESEWNAHEAFVQRIAEWEPVLEEQRELQVRLGHQIEYMKDRVRMQVHGLQSLPVLDRDSQHVKIFSTSGGFWDSFEDLRAGHESCNDIDLALRRADEDQSALNDAVDLNCRRDLHLVAHDLGPIASERELDVYQEVARIPDLSRNREELRERSRELRISQMERALPLLELAEAAFIKVSILEAAEEEAEDEGEQSGSGEPEKELPQASDPEDTRHDVRENLRVALEACRKARDDFENARIFSQDEIDQLPQPVTEDSIGAARAEKLMRLTHHLHTAENTYYNARKEARIAGLANPQEQSADFSDRSSDGYTGSLLQRAIDQGHERISRMARWTGLHVEVHLSPASPGQQMDIDESIDELQSVRLGEDSFDCTEASGRTRRRIDATKAASEKLREQNGFTTTEGRSLIAAPDDNEE